ncbi:META domain-containing protein [Lysobacter antibioticus]|uniref:META domain-containing protein n=1 Tax=Lysobacter antibioticus TaxID=84531 RepID=UPI0007165690|nr:META domain-containing protein [Lysobacter antibioticus]
MHRICSAAVLAAALAACSLSSATASKRAAPTYSLPQTQAGWLRAFDWYPLEATDAQGRRVRELRGARKRGLHVRFGDDSYRVKGACNTLSGAYRVEGERLVHDGRLDAVQTVAGCRHGAAMERAFFAQPLIGTHFSIDAHGRAPVLRITADDGARMQLIGLPAAPAR